MPYKSRFSRYGKPYVPQPIKSIPQTNVDWRGLDQSTPYDVMELNRTPEAKNFRIYAEEGDDRKVTVSSRKGSIPYIQPLSETLDVSITSSTGAADASIGVDTNWKAMKFNPDVTGPLTRIELELKKDSDSRGPIVVEIYSDSSGSPGTKLADSGILSSSIDTSYSFVGAEFVEAPNLTLGTDYWVVAYIQDDGSGSYYWKSNTASTLAKTSNTSGLVWNETTYSLNYKSYTSATTKFKGIHRYAPHNSSNQTLAAIGNNIYTVNDNTGALTSIISGLNSNATDVYVTYADNKAFIINGYDDVQVWDGSSATTLTHVNLPTLRLGTFHNNRFMGISADDPNQLVFSEDPGNDDGAGNEWYEAWLSTSQIYIPTPKASDPITAIVSFQDTLVVFTRTGKWVLYGTDPGSFYVRQPIGKKGAVHQNAVYADENYIYFVANDGIYRWDGSEDELISERVQPEFSSMADKDKVFVTKWNRMIRFYYPSSGSAVNDSCLIWHTFFEEWMKDTDSYVSHAVPLIDGDDNDRLIEASSTSAQGYYAEQADNNLGKAIDFEYKCRYDSMGNPAQKKRVVRLYPLLEAEELNYPVEIGVDRDRKNEPVYTSLPMTVGGALIGSFTLGDGTNLGGIVEYKPKRIRVSGYAYYWQVIIKRRGINNPVQFIGYVVSYRGKRL